MFPGTASKFFLKLLVTIPVAPIITGTIVHFRFHIRCISIHTLLYFNFYSASFCTTFLSAGIATSISVQVFSFWFLIIIIIIINIEFLTSQLWLGNIPLSWDVLINRITLGGLICSLKSFLQLNMCQELQIFASVYMYWGAS